MARSPNKTFYHYRVTNNVENTTKFYRTCKEITDEYHICRATIYNMINKPVIRTRRYKHLDIEQMLTPIPL